jgi:hypothetical protein
MPELKALGNPKVAKRCRQFSEKLDRLLAEFRQVQELAGPNWEGGLAVLEDKLRSAASQASWLEWRTLYFRSNEEQERVNRIRHHQELAFAGHPAGEVWLQSRGIPFDLVITREWLDRNPEAGK